MEYSLKKGAQKGATSVLVITMSMVAFAGFSDITIWSLIEEYLKPLVSSLTVGGLLTMVLNYIKVKNVVS